MKEILIQFLSKFSELNRNQVLELAKLLTVLEVKRDKDLVKEGEICNLCYFVLKGCLRQYLIIDGTEKTIGIFTENQAINYYTNQFEQQNSESFLTCIEDSVLLVGNPDTDEELFIKFPVLANITRKMMETDFGKTQKALTKVITLSPEQRYLNLIDERPELLQRVPQHIIASYIGVTPESLSRIRKRLIQNKFKSS